jgi:endo-1,4-beta-xylanase
MQRRRFLHSALGLTGLAALRAQSPAVPRLRDIAARSHLLAGSAVSNMQLRRPEFTALLAAQAGIVVPENEMKWGLIHPEPDRFDFARSDALLAFAVEHDQKLRGHNLCWHEQLPRWFSQVATAANAETLLRRHIAAVAGHYAGKIHSWDVVNEAIKPEDGRADSLRKTLWLDLVGPHYLDIAFHAAAEADPHAILTYNDYDIEQDTPAFETKRRAVLQLLTSLLDRQVPVQALGVQAHLKASPTLSGWEGFHRLLDAVERLGLQVFVTELDVDDTALPSDIKERDHAVAGLYRDFLTAALQHGAVKAVLTWGLTDRDSWLTHVRHRADGLPQRPLPFDADLQPKEALTAMSDALAKSASSRARL